MQPRHRPASIDCETCRFELAGTLSLHSKSLIAPLFNFTWFGRDSETRVQLRPRDTLLRALLQVNAVPPLDASQLLRIAQSQKVYPSLLRASRNIGVENADASNLRYEVCGQEDEQQRANSSDMRGGYTQHTQYRTRRTYASFPLRLSFPPRPRSQL